MTEQTAEEKFSESVEQQSGVQDTSEDVAAGSSASESSENQEADQRHVVEFEPDPEWERNLPPEIHPQDIPRDEDGKRRWGESVDLDKLPPELRPEWERRLKVFWKSQQATDRYLNQLGRDLPQMIESKAAELLEQRVAQEQHKESRKSDVAKALEDMDYERVADLLTQEPEPQPQQESRDLDPATVTKIRAWETERDPQTGNLVREWASPGHPLHSYAMQQTNALMAHPQMQGASVDDVLSTLDSVMTNLLGTQEQPTQPARKAAPQVLDSDANLRVRQNTKKISLTDAQKRVAERLFGVGQGSKNLTKEQMHEKYLKSLSGLMRTGKMSGPNG